MKATALRVVLALTFALPLGGCIVRERGRSSHYSTVRRDNGKHRGHRHSGHCKHGRKHGRGHGHH